MAFSWEFFSLAVPCFGGHRYMDFSFLFCADRCSAYGLPEDRNGNAGREKSFKKVRNIYICDNGGRPVFVLDELVSGHTEQRYLLSDSAGHRKCGI